MFYDSVTEVIPEHNVVCVSPHYDDFLFFLGGYFENLKKQGGSKNVTHINTFSRSNYQERDEEGNKKTDLARVQQASGIRIFEDLNCLDEVLGEKNYQYILMGEMESIVRGHPLEQGDGEMEMSVGSYETMIDADRETLARMKEKLKEYLKKEDTAVVLPLAMKGHIDHFIVREAGLCAAKELGKDCKATVYFAEDKPYAGIMNEYEAGLIDEFVAENDLKDRAFAFSAKEMLRLAYAHYKSQVDEIYDTGIFARAQQLKELYGKDFDVDRIFIYQNK